MCSPRQIDGSEDVEVELALDKTLQLRVKAWFEKDGQPLLGFGRSRLLAAIEREGSISAAARATGISYKRAWHLLDRLNRLSPSPVFRAGRGGRGGGGARLTPYGRRLLALFQELDEALQRFCRQSCHPNRSP